MRRSVSSVAPNLQRAVLSLLRGERPEEVASPEAIESALRTYECGGYLHHRWAAAGQEAVLPAAWSSALRRAHRKTAVDNLMALSEFRAVGEALARERIPFILLKGASYLVDLYDDPAARMLTDIDLLIRPGDAARAARRLATIGFHGEPAGFESRFRRFEMRRGGVGGCGFEFHWWLGLPWRFRLPQEEIWHRAVPCVLDGVRTLRLAREDALLYHVAHLADHYFGPSLKWMIDLGEMLRRWDIDAGTLRARSAEWRVGTALHLALLHLETIAPGDSGPRAIRPEPPGRIRRSLLHAFLSEEPLVLLDVPGPGRMGRYLLRLLLVDRLSDAVALATEGLIRPLVRPVARAFGWEAPPWEWPDRRRD